MADQPTKADINAIFKRLRSIPTNKQCFDCSHSNPTWASVTYGVFLCIDCSAVHRSLGVHVTFIRSTQLDTSWSWLQLRAMQVGGNANAISYFRQHGCDTTDAQKKYHSRAATLYKEKLLSLAQQACRLHGTKLHLGEKKLHIDGAHHEPQTPEAKEVDFFKEHTEFDNKASEQTPIIEAAKLYSAPQPIKNGSLSKGPEIDPSEGPNVEAALSMSPTQAAAVAEPRKVIIGGKKTSAAKKGKGLGAQRVKANFSEIENRAQQLDKEREELAKANAVQEAKTKEEQDRQMATMRLAYQDMSLQRKKQEDKLKAEDPKKAAQFERLGMGFAGAKGISHSAISDMQTIQQEGVKDKNDRNNRRRDVEDDMEMFGGSRFSSSRYGDSYGDSSYGSKRDDFGSWGNPNKGGSWDIDRFDSSSSSDKFSSKDNDSTVDKKEEDDNGSTTTSSSSSKKTYSESTSSSSGMAGDTQKRFSSAKAISSDDFFGRSDSQDFEMKQKLRGLEGRSGISSDDVFGTGSSSRSSSSTYYSSASPDLQDIKDGVKQGVTKVAGKISSLANGVLNSLQDRYGS